MKIANRSRPKLLVYVFGVLISVYSATALVCNEKSDSKQCDREEVCKNNICVKAVHCGRNGNCPDPETSCITDYCQFPSCTFTGQCVHGQVCSMYGVCVYLWDLNAQEHTKFTIELPEPLPKGTRLKEIQWSKGNTDSKLKVVFAANNHPLYFNGYCQTKDNCDASSKVHLNMNTGALSFYNVSLSDEGNYFYWFEVDSGFLDTGTKYEIYMEVYVMPKKWEMTLTGLPDEVEVGTEVKITCIVKRIKPKATDIYWKTTIGHKEMGDTYVIINTDGTFQYISTNEYRITKKYSQQNVLCTVKTMYGEEIHVKKRFHITGAQSDIPKTSSEVPSKQTTSSTSLPDKTTAATAPSAADCTSKGIFVPVILPTMITTAIVTSFVWGFCLWKRS